MSVDLRKQWDQISGRSRDRLVAMALGFSGHGVERCLAFASQGYFFNLIKAAETRGWQLTLSIDSTGTRCTVGVDGGLPAVDRASIWDAFALAFCLRAGVVVPEEWLG